MTDLVRRLRYQADTARNNYPEVFRVSEDIAYEAADRIEKLEAQAHYVNGVADLAMKHRNYAEQRVEKLEAALRKIKDLHDQPGPEDEQVIIIRDDMTYFIVCEALEELK